MTGKQPRRKRSFPLLFAFPLLMLAGVWVHLGHPPTLAASEPIKIAAIFAYTGSAAESNIHSITGVRDAAREINDRGGILGRPVTLIEIDNRSTPIGSKIAALRAAREGVVAIVGADWSSHSLAVAAVAQEKGIPMISNVSTVDSLTRIGQYIFRVCYTDTLQGRALASFALKDLGARRAAVIVDISSDYGMSLASSFSLEFEKSGGSVSRVEYTRSSLDLDRIARVTAFRNADVVFIPGYDESASIAGRLRAAGVNASLLGGDGWGSQAFYRRWNRDIANAYFAGHWGGRVTTRASRDFLARYGSGSQPIVDTQALAYDAFMLCADAIRRAGSTQREKVREALAQTREYQGVTGTISFDKGRDPLKDVIIFRIEKASPIYFKTIVTR